MKQVLKSISTKLRIQKDTAEKIPSIHECVQYKTINKLPPLPKPLKKKYTTQLEILDLAYQNDIDGANELDDSLWTPLHRYIVSKKNIVEDNDEYFAKLFSITNKKNVCKNIPFNIVNYLLMKNHERHPMLLNTLLETYINDLDISFFFHALDYNYQYEVLIYKVLLPRLEFAVFVEPIYGITSIHKILWKWEQFIPNTNHLIDLLIDIFPNALSMKCEPRFNSLPLTMAIQKHASEDLLLKLIEWYPAACNELDSHGNTVLHVLIKNLTIYKSVIYQICQHMPNAIHHKNIHGESIVKLAIDLDVDVDIIRSLKRIHAKGDVSSSSSDEEDGNIDINKGIIEWENPPSSFFTEYYK
jgi:hypothetical protein